MRWAMRLWSARPFTATALLFATLVPFGCGSSDSSFEVASTEVTKVTEEAREGYTYVRYTARQPEFRDRASDGYVDQKLEVAIEHAGRFPGNFDGVISSSAPVDPVVMHTGHDVFARERLGDESYAQVVGHVENLAPQQLFDQTWIDREFLEAIVAGAMQRGLLDDPQRPRGPAEGSSNRPAGSAGASTKSAMGVTSMSQASSTPRKAPIKSWRR